MKYAIPATFGILLAALLIGQRFGFAWAGGTGYVPELSVFIQDATGPLSADRLGERRPLLVDDRVYRGETIVTEPGTFAQLTISNFSHILTVGLDERTSITIDAATPDRVDLYLHSGRIETFDDGTIGTVGVRTNFVRTESGHGRASFVNYDFKETVGVIPIVGTVDVTTTKNDETQTISSPIEIHETEPVTSVATAFDPAGSAARNFYTWIETRFGLEPFEIIE